MGEKKESLFNKLTQFLLPSLTVFGFLLTSIKKPELGLVVSLVSQIFWLYSGWRAWKEARQIGIFITSVIITVIVIYGIINYWFLE